MDNDLPKCRDCDDVLTSENWYESCQKKLDKICKNCVTDKNRQTVKRNQEKNKNKDPYDGSLKVCSMCKEIMPRVFENFVNAPSILNGLSSVCRDCSSIRDIMVRAKRRHEPWTPPTPFTGKEARALKKKQNHRCFVCDKKENGERLSLDHSHHTGKIRGYACGTCNEGLIRWLDYMWYIHKNKRDWVKSDPIFYQILWHPPAEYLYKNEPM